MKLTLIFTAITLAAMLVGWLEKDHMDAAGQDNQADSASSEAGKSAPSSGSLPNTSGPALSAVRPIRKLTDCDAVQQKLGGAGVLVATVRVSCTMSKHPNENCKGRLNPKGYPTAKTYCIWTKRFLEAA